jgi:hypothetical protein
MSPARELVRRVRALQVRRHALTAAKDHTGAVGALELAVSLLDAASRAELRDAVLHATNPANTPPVPVVLGPQDVAAVVSRDELLALVRTYGQACYSLARREVSQADCGRTLAAVAEAVEKLCQAAPTYELDGGRTS